MCLRMATISVLAIAGVIVLTGAAKLARAQSCPVITDSQPLNINAASAAELDTLWGIGQSRAADIIDQRPYNSPEDLLSKGIIPENVYERIKDEISVY